MNIESLTLHLIETQPIAFLGSVDEQGFPNIRAMLRPRKWHGIKTIYFSTNVPSNKVRQFQKNAKACIYFCDSVSFQSVLLIGTMEVLTDQLSKQMVWRDGDEQYYPNGIAGSDYCVLQFSTKAARTYCNMQTLEYKADSF